RLKRYAQTIGSGGYFAPNPLKGRGELFELGRILEQTGHKLADTLSILEKREQKLAVTLQSIGDALIATDTDGRITRMNRQAERLTGWLAADAIGRSHQEVFRITDTTTNTALPSPVEKVLKSGEIVQLGNRTVLHSREHKRFHINNNASPILDDEGNMLGAVLVFSDVTEKYLLREQLQYEKEQLQHILDNSIAGIYTLAQVKQSGNGFEFKYVNKTLEAMSGFSISDWSSRPDFWRAHIHPDDLEQAESERFKAVSAGLSVQRYRFMNAHGEYRWIRDHLTVHRDRNGNLADIVGIWLDVTDETMTEQKNRQLGDILEHSRNEIYLFDAETLKFVQVNLGARQNLGYSAEEMLEMTPPDIAPDMDRGTLLELAQPLRQGTRSQIRFESVHRRKNHTLYPIEVNLQYFCDGGRPVFCAVVQDTTERRAAEYVLKETNRKLQNILAASPSVIYSRNIDEEFSYAFVSDNIVKLLGYNAEQFMSDPALRRNLIHPDDKPLPIAEWLPLKQGRRLQNYRCLHQDGRYIWVQDELIALTGPDGDCTALIGSLTDIDALKRTEKQLSDERSLLSNLIDNIPDLVFVKDPNGVYLLCNKAFQHYLGRPPEDIVGYDDFAFVDADSARFFRDHDIITLNEGKPHTNEEWLNYHDGRHVCLEMLKTPFKNENGTLLGLIGIGRDITERKLYEEKRLRLSDLKSCLTEISRVINHIKTESDLFQAVCRILIDNSSLYAAWFGVSEPESGGVVSLVEYCRDARPDSVSPPDFVRNTANPALSALQQNTLSISTTPVGDTVIRACASMPVLFHRQPYAVLTVCSDTADYFDDDIVRLLQGLTDELGFALNSFAFAEMQRRTKEKLELSAKVFEQSQEGIMISDAENRIISVNQAFKNITGYDEADVIGQDPKILKSGVQDHYFYEQLWNALKSDGFWQGEIWNRNKAGEVFPEWLTVSVVCDDNGNVTNYIGVFSDLSKHKEAEQRIEHMAHYDPLTDLPNRILLKARIDHEISIAKRHMLTLAVLFIDLDHFKYINDSLGHATGDKLLIEISRRLRVSVRDEDTVARLGGDEFTVQLCNIDAQGAAKVADKIIKALSAPIYIEGKQLHVTPSIGICIYPENGTDYDALTRNADTAMYYAKQKGRNQYRFFTAEMQEKSQRRLAVENDLRSALKRRELSLHFQPQVAAGSSEIVGAEALLRWLHPQWGYVSPAEFIPIAEDCGLIMPIGDWVLEQA
ncbi:MAG: PAS domain S-box protein, partial [Gammaproteobacteria bacterium]